eukprot:COSAG02_NODE_1225_length_13785_cov_12.911588_9_plen_127_part_00
MRVSHSTSQSTGVPCFWLSAQNLQMNQNNGEYTNTNISTVVLVKFAIILRDAARIPALTRRFAPVRQICIPSMLACPASPVRRSGDGLHGDFNTDLCAKNLHDSTPGGTLISLWVLRLNESRGNHQ